MAPESQLLHSISYNHLQRIDPMSDPQSPSPVNTTAPPREWSTKVFLGYGCSHCVAQLLALDHDLHYSKELDADIVAISSDSRVSAKAVEPPT
jgi:hypothetical protein